jgi:hypothetical protein
MHNLQDGKIVAQVPYASRPSRVMAQMGLSVANFTPNSPLLKRKNAPEITVVMCKYFHQEKKGAEQEPESACLMTTSGTHPRMG